MQNEDQERALKAGAESYVQQCWPGQYGRAGGDRLFAAFVAGAAFAASQRSPDREGEIIERCAKVADEAAEHADKLFAAGAGGDEGKDRNAAR